MLLSVLFPVLVPVKVKVCAPPEDKLAPVLVNCRAPLPDASILAPPEISKRRSVESPAPVYLSVPPYSIWRLTAALDDEPIVLFWLPFLRLDTCNMPPSIYVNPE